MTRFYFGLTLPEFMLISVVSMLGGLSFQLYSPGDSVWIVLGFMFCFFVVGHMCALAQRTVILPELIAFVACIQWLVAPWLSYHHPPTFPLYRMIVPTETYFSFMVPASIALWIGLHLPIRLRRPGLEQALKRLTMVTAERRVFDFMILVGFGVMFLAPYLPRGLEFLYYLLGLLRFVGAFAHMFAGSRRWGLRMALVYGSLMVDTSVGGVFYELVLWCGYLFISIAYIRRWRWKLLLMLLLALYGLVLFNDVKRVFRYEVELRTYTKWERVRLLGDLMVDEIKGARHRRPYDPYDTFGDRIVRYNQGWITARVMDTVPRHEPFAQGSTIRDAIVASIVPRVFLPGKIQSVSKDFFKRYTMISLNLNVSMALGTAGEMYLNFGVFGGVAATLIYGVFIGFIFSRFARRARDNVLWWAWAPFVLLSTVEAEWNLVDILNNIAKALMVMFILIYFVPVLKQRFLVRPRLKVRTESAAGPG